MASLADLAAQFATPPRSFSPAPIWWWSGEPLERGRLRWQLEQFAAGGVFNLVVLNLAPSGPLYASDADDPPFLSEAWWAIFLAVCADAAELGVQLWFYDQIGFSGANLQAQLARAEPSFAGQELGCALAEGDGPLALDCPAEGEPLAAFVLPLDPPGPPRPATLRGRRAHDESPGRRRLRLVYRATRGFDYTSPAACAALIDTVHGAFERRAGHLLGTVIAGSFQDELPSMPTWGAGFAAAFRARCGYDLTPLLWALWEGAGPQAEQARRDYHQTRAELAERALFRPLWEWHARHGLICGFDQQGPAREGHPSDSVRCYADYLRTHRWYGAPGSDHQGDAKIHSSLAHLYGRPRVWAEAFHSTGWGGTLEETLDWLLPWLRAGATLYNPHAAYYSTRGGWWEWAPPSTCWRQPYWRHYPHFAGAVARLCWLLSQGQHVCDVAVLFPTTTVQASLTLDGPLAPAQLAHDTYLGLAGRMFWGRERVGALAADRRDFDVLDDDSLQRGELRDGALHVAGERYRAVVLPACQALEPASAAALRQLAACGGLLVAIGCAPPELHDLFACGTATLIASADELPQALAGLARQADAPVPLLHRRIDGRDTLLVTGSATKATTHTPSEHWGSVRYDFDPQRYLRHMTVELAGARGAPQLWDPLSGARYQLTATPTAAGVAVEVPLTLGPAALLVWPAPDDPPEQLPPPPRAGEPLHTIGGPWSCRVEPTIDNRYGDLARPPSAEPFPIETWRVEQRAEGEGRWEPATAGFATYGWWLGPLPAAELPPPLAGLATGDDPLQVLGWRPAAYSLSRGIAHDPIHPGALGPKGHVPEEFLLFGPAQPGQAVRLRTALPLDAPLDAHLAIGAPAAKRAWLNGAPLGEGGPGYLWLAPARLRAGLNLIEIELEADEPHNLRASWAIVRDAQAFARPAWLSAPGAPSRGARLRFSAEVDIPFEPHEATVQLGADVPCRLLINGAEAGRQGGFDPYGSSTRIQPYTTRLLKRGANQIVVEADEGHRRAALVVDALVRGAGGEWLSFASGPHWRAARDGAEMQPAELRRKQWVDRAFEVDAALFVDVDPAWTLLWRRPHPLPGAAWLEGPQGDAVLAAEPDAWAGSAPARWLRWQAPPGATHMRVPLPASAELWADGEPLAWADGEAALPGGPPRQIVARVPAGLPGGALAGPIRYRCGEGQIALGPWGEQGLESFSGCVRYRASLTLAAAAAGLTLDLGRVRGSAEVWIDGQLAGVRLCAPYQIAVGALAAGQHTLEVRVCGTLAPYLAVASPTSAVAPGQELTGLLGPVTLRLPE